MFRFKQFRVDQSGCAMKINTDGVLLGAMIEANNPESILDIGTGTGVIALMLAQKYPATQIDAVEIDVDAAQTAEKNFKESPFADRMRVFPSSFENHFEQNPERKYDLIVSNPPFYIDSLISPGVKKTVAKHTNVGFFEELIAAVSAHLTTTGLFWLILPDTMGDLIAGLAAKHSIFPLKIINVKSYQHANPHRMIVCFSFRDNLLEMNNFTIYKERDVYSDEYQILLQPYFLAF